MITYEVGTIELSEDNKKWFNRKGYTMTGETLKTTYSDGTQVDYVVFKGTWTRSGTVRDCGDHYIYAGYSSYTRIDKGTLASIENAEDR